MGRGGLRGRGRTDSDNRQRVGPPERGLWLPVLYDHIMPDCWRELRHYSTRLFTHMYVMSHLAHHKWLTQTLTQRSCPAVFFAENTCTAKADAAAWAAEGCVVAGVQTATTVSGLGAQSAASGYQNCSITCPTDGGSFAVTAQAQGPTAEHITSQHITS